MGLAIACALATGANAATVFGINFARDGGGTTTGNAGGVEQSNWTDVFDSDGFGGNQNKPLAGSPTTASWVASNSWWAGSNADSEQRIYACYLDDGGSGVQVTITGLSAWLAAEGQSSYQIRAFCSTDTSNATFQTITIHMGDASGTTLGTIAPAVLGDDDYPTNPYDSTNGPRGYGDSNVPLTADTITLTIPVRDGSIRGTLAALTFTAVPEPSTALLGGIGLLGFLRRRRA